MGSTIMCGVCTDPAIAMVVTSEEAAAIIADPPIMEDIPNARWRFFHETGVVGCDYINMAGGQMRRYICDTVGDRSLGADHPWARSYVHPEIPIPEWEGEVADG